VLTQVLDQSV